MFSINPRCEESIKILEKTNSPVYTSLERNVPGIGPRNAIKLKSAGVKSEQDLIYIFETTCQGEVDSMVKWLVSTGKIQKNYAKTIADHLANRGPTLPTLPVKKQSTGKHGGGVYFVTNETKIYYAITHLILCFLI